jgi:excisionase family DNA binding protein
MDSLPDRYLTAAEVAELLQVHPATIYRLAAQCPTMPALKLGNVVRFPRERLLVWLRDREQGRPRARRAGPKCDSRGSENPAPARPGATRIDDRAMPRLCTAVSDFAAVGAARCE